MPLPSTRIWPNVALAATATVADALVVGEVAEVAAGAPDRRADDDFPPQPATASAAASNPIPTSRCVVRAIKVASLVLRARPRCLGLRIGRRKGLTGADAAVGGGQLSR